VSTNRHLRGVFLESHEPWFAIAFRAGQEQRLSPFRGGTYSGQIPPSPGLPFDVTCPILRLKVSTLIVVREMSQSIKPTKKAPWKSFEYVPRAMRRSAVMMSTMVRGGEGRGGKGALNGLPEEKKNLFNEWARGIDYISPKRRQRG
jgi:hypothetical protein